MGQVIRVGIADFNIAKSPDILVTLGLGSCVGVALYDKVAKIGGLAHIMLPDSKQAREGQNPAKFADSAIPLLIEKMERAGASKSRIVAKIAGGAQMFSFSDKNLQLSIGKRNVEAVKAVLAQEKIPLVSEDTGGGYGRSVELHTDTGKFIIRTVGHGIKEL
ncbi:MAG: chemotaxis protein CheD [Synergistetes bacterium]|nr:chemotaxis protein CheD [Synergistota bacterium]MDW8193056.1 chemotaxis protein CheD [Synergistota bacterium]